MSKSRQSHPNHLWIPFFIVGVGFLASFLFVIWALKDYHKPAPLLIKPSSLDSGQEISSALSKALFPYRRIYSVKVQGDQNDFLYQDLSKNLPPLFLSNVRKKLFFQVQQIDLNQQAQSQKTDCLNSALFNLNRKKERKWKNKIYFCVCVKQKDHFILYYAIN